MNPASFPLAEQTYNLVTSLARFPVFTFRFTDPGNLTSYFNPLITSMGGSQESRTLSPAALQAHNGKGHV